MRYALVVIVIHHVYTYKIGSYNYVNCVFIHIIPKMTYPTTKDTLYKNMLMNCFFFNLSIISN